MQSLVKRVVFYNTENYSNSFRTRSVIKKIVDKIKFQFGDVVRFMFHQKNLPYSLTKKEFADFDFLSETPADIGLKIDSFEPYGTTCFIQDETMFANMTMRNEETMFEYLARMKKTPGIGDYIDLEDTNITSYYPRINVEYCASTAEKNKFDQILAKYVGYEIVLVCNDSFNENVFTLPRQIQGEVSEILPRANKNQIGRKYVFLYTDSIPLHAVASHYPLYSLTELYNGSNSNIISSPLWHYFISKVNHVIFGTSHIGRIATYGYFDTIPNLIDITSCQNDKGKTRVAIVNGLLKRPMCYENNM